MTESSNGTAKTSNWGQVGIGVIVVVISLASSFYSVFNSGTDKQFVALAVRIDLIQKEVDLVKANYLTQAAYTAFGKRYDENEGRSIAAILKIQSDMVPLSTHQQKWAADAATIVALGDRLAELRREIGSNYTIGDKLKELQRQVENLSRRPAAD